MINKKNRAGTSQNDKLLTALQPGYVSVEERSLADLLRYAKQYAAKVRFYEETNQSSQNFWTSFLDFSDAQILDLVEFVENPEIFKEDSQRLAQYSQPHLAVWLTFLKLLQYPQEKFAQLTEKKVAYFYRDILKLEERAEVPDQVHVIFKLAKDVREHQLKKGTLLTAGKDATGADLHYEVTEDIILNNAEISDIKTVHFTKTVTDIKYVHQSYDYGDAGFEKVLCLVLGNISSLPPYVNAQGQAIAVDAKYLRTELYKRIKGKEKDDLDERDANYIFNSLCFRFLKDFRYCLDLLYREMNRGYVGITYPEDYEWEKAYTILEGVHKERIARSRRAELKKIHKDEGFESMMEFAFGEPEPGNMLYKMPGSISTLQELLDAQNEAARKYIENKLCMSDDDFKVIMAKRDIATNSAAGDEVYALLEAAWTKKRNYRYPEIGSEKISGYYADTIFPTDKIQEIPRFQTFGKSSLNESSATIDLGFAVSSPLLRLNEGTRTIEMVISCEAGTIEYEKITSLLAANHNIFTTQLSVNGGWRKADQVRIETGSFIMKPELKTFNEETSYLVCDTLKYPVFDNACPGKYLVFKNGKVYKIVKFDGQSFRIYLSSVHLEYPVTTTSLVKKLVPKTFFAEVTEKLCIDKHAVYVRSSKENFADYHEGKYLVDCSGKIFLLTRFISASEVEVRYCGDISNRILDLEGNLDFPQNTGVVQSPKEIFAPYYQGKYWIDSTGTLFSITKFVSPNEVEVKRCGGITTKATSVFDENEQLMINKIWGTIEPEYEAPEIQEDIVGIDISRIYAAENRFFFEVTDSLLKVRYPEGATAQELITAWEVWKDNPLNQPGRYELQKAGNGGWLITPVNQNLEKTGEIIKRYESAPGNGLRVSYRGRPVDTADLIITEPSMDSDRASFLIADGILTITPGRISQTANQITVDWRFWIAANDPKGFQVESLDEHIWNAVPVSELELAPVDQVIKKCEICDLYGVGIRVLYTGSGADRPRITLQENSVDLFEFVVRDGPQLIAKYPCASVTSAYELVEAWREWKASEVNDPGNFDIERMGDGLWTVQAKTERVLQASEHGTIECNITNETTEVGIGVIARYQLSDIYKNALIEFKPDSSLIGFRFEFSDVTDTAHQNIRAKKLIIHCQPLPENTIDTQIRHVQALLGQWNRVYNKQGFSLLIDDENAKWDPGFLGLDPVVINFLDPPNYVCVVDPNGFITKYTPVKDSPLTSGAVVIHENNNEDDNFGFHITSDYQNHQKILYIEYPTTRTKRTVEALLSAFESIKTTLPIEFKEFKLLKSGTGKWQITGITELELTATTDIHSEYDDPVNQRFFEYKTNDVNGFTICYTGPPGTAPQVTIAENDKDTFEFEVSFVYKEFYDREIADFMWIKYPRRTDKRRVVDLLSAWVHYTQNISRPGPYILGFEIFDTSAELKKRSRSKLLDTGDLVREFQAGPGNGICIDYIGHRTYPTIVFEPIVDFHEDDAGKKILWDNGEVFTVSGKLDRNNVAVEPGTRNIGCIDAIKLYQPDAICLDGLKFTINLDGEFPAVVSPLADEFSSDPAIKILLDNKATADLIDEDVIFYEYFKTIRMRRIDLKVTVNGLTDIKMRGNLAMINPANPFNPFGLTPDTPARFYFANRELCEKKLDSMNINIDWAENVFLTADGLPDMKQYYHAYSHCGLGQPGTIKNEDFETELRFLDRRTFVPISSSPQPLFEHTLSYHDFQNQTYQGKLFPENADIPKDPADWPRYFKMELTNQGFMRELYQTLLNEIAQAQSRVTVYQNNYNIIKQEIKAREEQIKAARLAEAEARENSKSFTLPVIPDARPLPVLPENDWDISNLRLNPPYTPVIRFMSIDYTASTEMLLDTTAGDIDTTQTPVRIFRFHPFGYEEMQTPEDAQAPADNFLLPQYNQEGYLFIGIRNLSSFQSVSLLIQMVSGSGDANLPMPEIAWSYLASNQWIPFKAAEILKDKTFGLQDTGIIKFSIPVEATTANTVLPGGRCWIRAAAPKYIAAVPEILDIRAEAMGAVYRNQNNDPNHLAIPLAAYTIKELDERDSAIREVIQPYTSFNGKRHEEGLDFYVRVSERLKHKNRALTLDDYEKMILAQFPQVYKVKCMPQDERALMSAEFLAPEAKGEVVVIAILKNSNSTPFFPLKPKTPANILEEIKRYIQVYMPPLVKVTVRNPRFEEIRYRLAVKFKEGYDRGYYINVLNEDIKRFLSPWAYDGNAEISFGSSVYSSAVINYIENAEYVDYVANFCLLQQIIQHDDYTEVIPLFLTLDNAATTKYPESILVSAENHVIDVITSETYDPGAFSGIGHMQIATDFWISRPGPVFAVGLGQMEIEEWPVARYAFSNFKITIYVKLNGAADQTELQTYFSNQDSYLIWLSLVNAHYLDEKGKVFSNRTELYGVDPPLKLTGGLLFEDYLKNNIAQFKFQIARTTDFAVGEQASNCVDQVLGFKDVKKIKLEIIDMLKNRINFDGTSQYPFIVY